MEVCLGYLAPCLACLGCSGFALLRGPCCKGGKGYTQAQTSEQEAPPEKQTVRTKMTSVWNKMLGKSKEQQELQEMLVLLEEGTIMKYLPPKGKAVAVQLEVQDDTMLTYKSLQLENNLPVASGAMALSEIEAVEDMPKSWFAGADRALMFLIRSGTQEVKLQADSDDHKQQWMTSIQRVSKWKQGAHAEQKADRSLAYRAKRELQLQTRKMEADRRKNELMKKGAGGMKHTAMAMLNRSG